MKRIFKVPPASKIFVYILLALPVMSRQLQAELIVQNEHLFKINPIKVNLCLDKSSIYKYGELC